MPGRIRVTSGESAGAVIEVDDELIVGRSQEGQGRLPDIEISRRHARLYLDPDGGLAIEDLGSTNGTFVGGVRITAPRLLSPGDALRMGTTTLEVESVGVVAPAVGEPEEAEAEPVEEEPPAAEPPPPEGEPVEPPPPEAEPEPTPWAAAETTPGAEAPEAPAEPPADPLPPAEPPVTAPEAPPADETATDQLAPPVGPAAAGELPPSFGAAPGMPLPTDVGPAREPADAEGEADAAPAGAAPGEAAAPGGAVAPAPARRGGVPRVLVGVLAGVLLLGARGSAAVLLFGGDDEDEPAKQSEEVRLDGPPALVAAARQAGCTSRDLPPEGARHVDGPVRYRSNPPHSGDHDEVAATDGAYETSPPLPRLVHALEHGRIVMWYRPGNDEARKELREVGDEDPRHMILTPNTTNMPYEAAATAWGHVLGCPEMNDDVKDAVREFRDAYRDKGPEFVP